MKIENAISETSKYRHLTGEFCQGCGIDIASQGDPVVPWAWQLDLPQAEFAHYSSGYVPPTPIQLRGHAESLPIESNSLDFLYASHILEDFLDWTPILKEWVRVLKPGGKLIVLIPDKDLWAAALAKGQPPNDAHRHEGKPGELSSYASLLGVEPIMDTFTNQFEGDYTIMFVAKKL